MARGYYKDIKHLGTRMVYDRLTQTMVEASDTIHYFVDKDQGANITFDSTHNITAGTIICMEGNPTGAPHYYNQISFKDVGGSALDYVMLTNWNGRWGTKHDGSSTVAGLHLGAVPIPNQSKPSYFAKYIIIDGRGDSRWLGHWWNGQAHPDNYGIDLSNGWDGRGSHICTIQGQGSGHIIFDSVAVRLALFAGMTFKSDAYSERQGYNLPGLKVLNCFFDRNLSESTYIGYVGRAATKDPIYDTDGVTIIGYHANHCNVDLELYNNISAFAGSEGFQLQRMAGNWKIHKNFNLCSAAKWETVFQDFQNRANQINIYTGGQGGQDALFEKNITIGSGAMCMSMGENTETLNYSYNLNGTKITNSGPARFRNNFFGGSRSEMFQVNARDNHTNQIYVEHNYFMGWRGDIGRMYGPDYSGIHRWLWVNNTKHQARIFMGNNYADVRDSYNWDPYHVSPGSTICPVWNPHNLESAYVTATGPNKIITSDTDPDRFEWPVVMGGFPLKDWWKYRYWDNNGEANVDVKRDNTLVDGVYKYRYPGDFTPLNFEPGSIAMRTDKGFFKRLNSTGNSDPLTDPTNWEEIAYPNLDLRLDPNVASNQKWIEKDMGIEWGAQPSYFERLYANTRRRMAIFF